LRGQSKEKEDEDTFSKDGYEEKVQVEDLDSNFSLDSKQKELDFDLELGGNSNTPTNLGKGRVV